MPHHALPPPALLSSGQEATVAPAWGSERPGERRLFAQLSGICVQSCALISRKHGTHCLPALSPGPELFVRHAHPAIADKQRVEWRAPPFPGTPRPPIAQGGPGKVTGSLSVELQPWGGPNPSSASPAAAPYLLGQP